jgi:hemolysin III
MDAVVPEELVPRLRGVSHAVGFVVALGAAIVIVVLAPGGRATSAVAVYAAGLVALFGGSALYHRWPGPTRFKPLLRRIDHRTIFVFIAASYTPVALILMHGTIAWLVLVGAWAGAAVGVAFSLGWIDMPRPAVAGSYLALGWFAVIALP